MIAILFIAVLVSCKKQTESLNKISGNAAYKIENGLLSFKSSAVYNNFITDKGARSLLLNDLQNAGGFSSLKNNLLLKVHSFPEGDTLGLPPGLDSSLYPEYLLQILNADKMVEIDACYVKVDLENNRGLITKIQGNGKESYAKLKNDWIDDPEVIAISADEDGMEIIEWLNQGLTKAEILALKQAERERCARGNSMSVKDVRAYFIENTIPPYEGRSYVSDSKIVYQSAVIYFSLQAKIKTTWRYNSSNWPISIMPIFNCREQ